MEIKITVIPIYNSAKGMWSLFSEYDELDNDFIFENPQARIKSNENEIIVTYKRKQKISKTDEKFAKMMNKKYPGIIEHVKPNKKGKYSRQSPPGTT